MIDGLANAISVLLDWPNPLWLVGGVLFGMLIGFLPGMAGSVALALLIPVSFTMEPQDALLFLIAAYSPAGFGGMLTSILVNTPGSPENAATTFDGYPMAKQGRAGGAIGAATAASVIGGLVGTILLVLLIPAARNMVLAFSYPEFFMMAILGLTVIAVVTDRNTFKGLVAAGTGFLLAFIGLDPIVGSPRFTFDQLYLWDGINIVPVLIGLFAGAEALTLFGTGTSVASAATTDADAVTAERRGHDEGPTTFAEGVRVTVRHWFLVLRVSVLGTVIGIIPGVGGAVSGFLGYSHAKQTSKHPERFGKGAVEGVIAAESANDAKEGGSLLPTIAFGIPGTVGMAILLGALIMQGVPVGPTLMIDHSDLVYILVLGMVVSKFVAPIVVWGVAKHSTRLTSLRPGVFTPLIAVAALVGAFTVKLEILDVVVVMIFGYVGYAMRRYGFSRVALIIALALGELVERSYYQTVEAFDGPTAILTRPISGALVIVCAIVLVFAVVQAVRRTRETTVALEEGGVDELTTGRSRRPQVGRIVFDVVLLAFAVVIVVSATSITTDARTMPLLIGVPVIVAIAVQLIVDICSVVLPGTGSRLARIVGRRHPERHQGRGAAFRDPTTGTQQNAATTTATERPTAVQTTDRRVLLRQTAFGAWAACFVGLGGTVGFLIATPIALLFFLVVLARERWVTSLLISACAWAGIYLLFVLLLEVPL